VHSRYGKKMATAMFTHDHFRATKGWCYDPITGLFNTPEMRQIKSNLQYDNNLKAINILDKLLKEEELQREKDKKTQAMLNKVKSKAEQLKAIEEKLKDNKNNQNNKESIDLIDNQSSPPTNENGFSPNTNKADNASFNSGIADYAENVQLFEMVEKNNDTDLDSLDANNKKWDVKQVTVSDTSVASSISMTTTKQDDEVSSLDLSENTKRSNNTLSSKIALSSKALDAIVSDKTLTEEEVIQRVEKYQKFQIEKAKISSNARLEKLLIERRKEKQDNTSESENSAKKPKNKLAIPPRESTRLKQIKQSLEDKKRLANSQDVGSQV